MSARIVQLRTPADKLREEQAAELRQMVLSFPGLPERAASEIAAAIDRQTASAKRWTFVMLSPAQNAAVVRWIRENSKRPLVAVALWAELFDALRTDTGEVMLSRDELAQRIGATADHVSEIMGELEGIGAVSRRRQKVAGMRGPGMVRYIMNPRVATCLTGTARDMAQNAAPPLLVLMDGGAA